MSADLYHEALVSLARSGRAAGRLDDPQGSAVVDNPLCGDRVTLDVEVDGERIVEAAQLTRGCILTRAAAVLAAGDASRLGVERATMLEREVRDYLRGGDLPADLPELAVMEPVRDVRSRHDCVLVAFQALREATLAAMGTSNNRNGSQEEGSGR